MSLTKAPTRRGKVSFAIMSHVDAGHVDVDLVMPPKLDVQVYVRLRLPNGHRMLSASMGGKPVKIDHEHATLVLPQGTKGRLKVTVLTERIRRG